MHNSLSPSDARNGPVHQQWTTVFRDGVDPVAQGTWSSSKDDSSWRAGFRRYGASKLCQVMMMYFQTLRDPIARVLSANS
jgi:hypothetical protein